MSETDAEFVDRLVGRVKGGDIGYVLVVSNREEQTRLLSLARRGAESADTITALRAENEKLKTSGIAEVAAHNPSVMDWIHHWEGRTLKAEAEIEKLRAALWDIHAICNNGPFVWARRIRAIARVTLRGRQPND